MREPKAFLFDEPLSNLDAMLRVQMRQELSNLHHDLAATMIYVTHDQVEAMTMADRIVVLDQGRIMQVGAPLDLYERPANRFVAAFIGSPAMNFLPGLARSSDSAMTVELAGSDAIALPPRATGFAGEKQVEIGIRPEHVRLSSRETAALRGTTTVVEQLGNTTYVYVDTPVGQIIVEADGSAVIAPGTAVGLTIDATRAHVFDATGAVMPKRAD